MAEAVERSCSGSGQRSRSGSGAEGSSEVHDRMMPHVERELERMNSANLEVNEYENAFGKAKREYREMMNAAKERLAALSQKKGRTIARVRPYYDALAARDQTHEEMAAATNQFRRSVSELEAAKEIISLTEKHCKRRTKDTAAHEALAQATIKVMDSEKKRATSHQHKQKLKFKQDEADVRVKVMKKKYRRMISKAKVFYNAKMECEQQLKIKQQEIEEIKKTLAQKKHVYAESMQHLSEISESMHRQRTTGARTPGVGADSDDDDDFSADLDAALQQQYEDEEDESNSDSESDDVSLSSRDTLSVSSRDTLDGAQRAPLTTSQSRVTIVSSASSDGFLDPLGAVKETPLDVSSDVTGNSHDVTRDSVNIPALTEELDEKLEDLGDFEYDERRVSGASSPEFVEDELVEQDEVAA